MGLLSKISSRVALGGIATVGVMSGIGSSGREAAMDVAFGDPNADRAFLGSNLSGRFLLGSAMGGTMGGVLQATAPIDLSRTNPPIPTSPVATGTVGSVIGGIAGGAMGRSLKGGLIGAAIGGFVGSTAAPLMAAGGYVASNRDFFTQSPYANRSSATAAALNASGDIVLGMHNSRSSY
jgi:hypothetical protein